MRNARLGEGLFGAGLVALGAFAIYKAAALPIGRLNEPDSGLFPLAIGIVLSVFALLSLRARERSDRAPAERAGIARVLVLVAALAAYAWLLPRAGFIVCTLVLLALVLRGLGGARWAVTLVSAVAGTIGCYLLFTRLGLPLPMGVFGF